VAGRLDDGTPRRVEANHPYVVDGEHREGPSVTKGQRLLLGVEAQPEADVFFLEVHFEEREQLIEGNGLRDAEQVLERGSEGRLAEAVREPLVPVGFQHRLHNKR
jgi:hypothetical protein